MSDEKKTIDLGNIPPNAPDSQPGELVDKDLDKVAGGLRIGGGSPAPKPSKGTYIPAPPAQQVPIPYPSGM